MKKKVTHFSKDKNSLEKKIKAYSMAAVAVMATQPAAAAVVYSDIDPDVTFTGASDDYMIDLNNDGTDDFNLIFTVGTDARSLRIQPNIGNEVLGSTGGNYFYPFALNLNDPIDGAQSAWNGTANGGYFTMAWLYTTGGAYGNWFGESDKYIGLRFTVSGNVHYGWARLTVDANCSTVTIKDYAFDDSPNTAIAAGDDGTSGINDILPDHIDIFAFNKVLTVDLKDVSLNDAVLSLVSVNGQQVLNTQLNDSKTQLNLADIKRGIYLATIRSEEGMLTRRIYID